MRYICGQDSGSRCGARRPAKDVRAFFLTSVKIGEVSVVQLLCGRVWINFAKSSAPSEFKS
jgi:hypothetical protein